SLAPTPSLRLPGAHYPRYARQIGQDLDFSPTRAEQGRHLIEHVVANFHHHKASGLESLEGLGKQASIDFVALLEVAPGNAGLKLPHLPLHHLDVPLPHIGRVRNYKVKRSQKVLIEKSSQEVAFEE